MPRVVVLADDLIWQTRLIDAVRATGADADRARTLDGVQTTIDGADALVVDLTARAYDPLAAIRHARAARPALRILAVGQHDDTEARKLAIAAGAERVYAYRKVFEDGPGTLARWLSAPAGGVAR
jgi:DNA-binding response OmpR family regulator